MELLNIPVLTNTEYSVLLFTDYSGYERSMDYLRHILNLSNLNLALCEARTFLFPVVYFWKKVIIAHAWIEFGIIF